jgi:hypothetical protein
MTLKQRLDALEQVTKQDICLVHFIEEVENEDWSVTQERYRLEMGIKKGNVILSLADLELSEKL